jgi:hypothetical protein
MDDLLRRMSPAAKLARALALGEVARAMALTRLRVEHPDASDAELRRRLAIDLLPPALAERLRARARS